MAIVILLTVMTFATEAEFAPFGPAPLLNGRISVLEWQYPSVYESGWDKGSIYTKKDSQFVYICIAPKDTLHTGLDLYIDNTDGDIFMLHVSSAHGQRFLVDNVWEEMTWGPAELWTSNLVQMFVEKDQRVVRAPKAFEFQIARQLMSGDTFKMLIHFKRPERWIPDNADTLSSDTWYWHGLDRPTGQ